MKCKFFLSFALSLLLLAACQGPRDVVYFDDAKLPQTVFNLVAATDSVPRLQRGDRLNIIVSSPMTPELAARFNKVERSNYLSARQQDRMPFNTTNTSARGVSGYIVGTDGMIIFPQLGPVKAEGLTRDEVAAAIAHRLRTEGFLRDAQVVAETSNLYINVLGEVANPSRVPFRRDRLTLTEALAQVGDLTIHAQRKAVQVLRREGGRLAVYRVDMTKGNAVFSSPAYHLMPGDVVYAPPTKDRAREANAAGNVTRDPNFYVLVAGFLVSVASFILAF